MIEIEIWKTGEVIDNRGFRQLKYHAQIKGKPAFWGRGSTPNEAIGDLVDGYPEQFNVSITYLGRQSR